ncbi:cell cycle checkpoint protein RAD1-like [Galendromus occidentalis]|uniref:Cell cycle checkpoint protein RAD1-like n=1 Tax=Galendromus occidentalis TaxID=34638 RepID=A0AAJ6QTK5_9ACAR|nr:cell cycle checkpoint protein RAD1-like [Galendromus occidentalis]
MSECGEEFVLEAILDCPKVLLNVIKAVRLRKKRATLEISPEGIKFISEEDKWIQAVGFLQKQLFKQYDFKNGESCEEVSFEVSLDHLEHCLNLFNASWATSTVKIVYPGKDNTFVLFVEESGIFSEAEFYTFQCDDPIELETMDDVSNRILFSSELLKEIWAEMDQTASMLKLEMSSEKVSLATDTMRIEIGKTSDGIVLFESKQNQEVKYNMKILRATQKALSFSDNASVRLSPQGVMSSQFLMKNEAGFDYCIEFFCRPLDDFDDTESEILEGSSSGSQNQS